MQSLRLPGELLPSQVGELRVEAQLAVIKGLLCLGPRWGSWSSTALSHSLDGGGVVFAVSARVTRSSQTSCGSVFGNISFEGTNKQP